MKKTNKLVLSVTQILKWAASIQQQLERQWMYVLRIYELSTNETL